MSREMTLEEWQAGRYRRRQLSNLVSPGECGRAVSPDEQNLRAAFGGKRNRPFATDEELKIISEQATKK